MPLVVGKLLHYMSLIKKVKSGVSGEWQVFCNKKHMIIATTIIIEGEKYEEDDEHHDYF